MSKPRVAVISHAAVLAVNAEPFHALARRGFDVTLLAPSRLRTDLRGDVGLQALDGFAGRLVGLPLALGGYRRWLGGQRGIHLIVYRGLRAALDRARPDAVFVEEEPYSLAAAQAARWCRRNRVPLIVHQNQNLPRRLPKPFETIRRRVLAVAAACTVRSPSVETRLREDGFDGPVAAFPHAIDPARYAVEAADPGVAAPVVGFAGRLVAEKGILEVVAAVTAIHRRGASVGLLVVGDGPLREAAETQAAYAGLSARFTGSVAHDDVPRFVSGMDLVVVASRPTPTWTEQFGRVPIEANAAGVPVVATDAGELAATVEATGGGVVVPAGDPGALEAAIEMLLADPQQRRRLGERGRRGVEARFTHAAVSEALAALLASIIERAKR